MEQETHEAIPEDIADIVFHADPTEPNRYSLVCDDVEPIELFEIFLTIMMEGVIIKNSPITYDKYMLFTPEVVEKLNPWLRSLGYQANITTLTRTNIEEYNKFYSKIIMKCDPSWITFFKLHHIEKDYHFVISQLSPYVQDEYCDLTNLYAVLIVKDTVYKITFSCI